MDKESFQKRYEEATRLLGGSISPVRIRDVWAAGDKSERGYHDSDHFAFIGNEIEPELREFFAANKLSEEKINIVDAVTARAGFHHDVFQLHVDREMPEEASRVIRGYLKKSANGSFEKSSSGNLIINDELSSDLTFKMALALFDYKPGQEITPLGGGNEFVSALFAGAQGEKDSLPAKYRLAEMFFIAGTVPFKAPNYFTTLEERLKKANEILPENKRLSEDEIKMFSIGACAMANRDVIGFRESFSHFNRGGRDLLIETGRNFDNPDEAIAGYAGQKGFLKGFVHANSSSGNISVFHSSNGYPDDEKLAEFEERARRNIEATEVYLNAHIAATGVLSALHVAAGRGGVDSIKEIMNGFERPKIEDPVFLSDASNSAINELRGEESGRFVPPTKDAAYYLVASIPEELIKEISGWVLERGIKASEGKAGMESPEMAKEFLEQLAQKIDVKQVAALSKAMGIERVTTRGSDEHLRQ